MTAIKNNALTASGSTATSIMILCGTTPLPGVIPLPCFSGANVDFVAVAWTADALACTGTCP